MHPFENVTETLLSPENKDMEQIPDVLLLDFSNTEKQDLLPISRTQEEKSNIAFKFPNIANFLMKSLDTLCITLESKAKHQKDLVLSNLFLMNNYDYILSSIRTPQIFKHIYHNRILFAEKKIHLFQENYIQASWNKAISCLLLVNKSLFYDPIAKSKRKKSKISKAEKKEIRSNFSNFNLELESQFRCQKNYVIPDRTLRDNIRKKSANLVIPLYQQFLERNSKIDFAKDTSKYYKYPVETVQKMIYGFFSQTINI
ncbi:exocyst complex component 7 [Anaeramoeba ignava]|uniref:Exocyst subunit Exo70 family protein n=1 Tax=Anaeramoeba ignava TaxID=1746090 RepID=A0A9Q0LLN3_ANAIG|nr:exocyst complex component 7 [Anaeramoeba ignava]